MLASLVFCYTAARRSAHTPAKKTGSIHLISYAFAPFLVSHGGIMSLTPPFCISPQSLVHMTSSPSWGSDVCADWATSIVWKMVACPRISCMANYIELADQNCAIKMSSSMTWQSCTSLHSPGKHLLPIATNGVPLWVMVIHCQPQATHNKWRSTELIVVNDGIGHDENWQCIVLCEIDFLLIF